ncbi:hypothetical protein BED46_031110 [Burkholderia contaminans]|uniref:Uncharacterized protein n=1 Tax=Burkholderia contaminans LMG 23361 TaxID=1334628 RepID=A0ABD4B2I1_9BURK|nr:hypothetical protein WR31_02630 [Burkholderia contaminans LMG 23361]MBA9832049.1 hypothetical protein [Burkholderia contaminans]MBA9839379.1 hypothetical protein [Burkholderia contaminans]MBA9864852.1 hypothetical protein [Burkholderia contaminans]MBA9906822.1 hypothetical protein [Burkholderia contaminans]
MLVSGRRRPTTDTLLVFEKLAATFMFVDMVVRSISATQLTGHMLMLSSSRKKLTLVALKIQTSYLRH